MYVIASDSAPTLTSWFFTKVTAGRDTPGKIHKSVYSLLPFQVGKSEQKGVTNVSTGTVVGHRRVAAPISAVDAPGPTAIPLPGSRPLAGH